MPISLLITLEGSQVIFALQKKKKTPKHKRSKNQTQYSLNEKASTVMFHVLAELEWSMAGMSVPFLVPGGLLFLSTWVSGPSLHGREKERPSAEPNRFFCFCKRLCQGLRKIAQIRIYEMSLG